MTTKNIPFPIAKKVPFSTTHHGDTITDPYHWLRDPLWPDMKDPDVMAYLEAENNYYHTMMKPLSEREDKIYEELLKRIKLADESVPIKKDQYYYYTRTEETSNYPIVCRKLKSVDNPEEIVLDFNLLAKGHEFFSFADVSMSPDHQKVAYSIDTEGSERYHVQVKDLIQNKRLEDDVPNAFDKLLWHANGKGFFYCKLNENWRLHQVFYHQVGTKAEKDILVFNEENINYSVDIYKSASERFIFIRSVSKENAEVFFIDCHGDDFSPVLISKRTDKHIYYPDHIGNEFFILTNDTGKNFRLVKTSIEKLDQKDWQEVIPCSPFSYLQKMELYQKYFALQSREDGLEKIRIYSYDEINHPETILFQDPTYSASIIPTPADSAGVRMLYSSLSKPETTLEYSFSSKKLQTLKIKEIPGGYDSSLYQTERVFASTADGVKVPISLVYKKELFKKDGTNPLYLYGYGSYGHGIPAFFRSPIISLLDRGFVYAIAHIRGGDEMGYEWYESAKFLTKKRTFTDFIAAAEHLIHEKYTHRGNIVISGASAGGMLMGACINERPDLYKAAIAHVPFVDVLNTMLDSSLPLTLLEFKEWGNPEDEKYYHYIKSYSPYENVKAQAYPALYVTAGISDPRVTYWEPAKWVAKLREMKTDTNLVFLETYMHAGHAGAPGRFGFLRDAAKEYNFIFRVFSISVK